jgi:hypothetical protein
MVAELRRLITELREDSRTCNAMLQSYFAPSSTPSMDLAAGSPHPYRLRLAATIEPSSSPPLPPTVATNTSKQSLPTTPHTAESSSLARMMDSMFESVPQKQEAVQQPP